MCGGDPRSLSAKVKDLALFPACAGVILPLPSLNTLPLAFPRMCGGDPTLQKAFKRTPALFPACAGVIRS